MKYIALHNLIPILATNLQKNFNIDKKEVCNNLVSLMEGVANHATVRKNLPKDLKKWKPKTHCPTCNKRINLRGMAQHNIRTHGEKKLAA